MRTANPPHSEWYTAPDRMMLCRNSEGAPELSSGKALQCRRDQTSTRSGHRQRQSKPDNREQQRPRDTAQRNPEARLS
ncbi:hypothetical protein C0995_009520 [Termitomyces sp. Mi166|nr:hypothetical protein C0995_009520 [Termitomyces sp. Mi166\